MNLSIRPALVDEHSRLVALQRRASLANLGDRDALLAHPEAVNIPEEQFTAGNILVAEHNGTPLGFAALYLREDGDVELDGLFVEPDRWKGGIGRVLVEAAVGHAMTLGARKLHVIGNPHAEGFYLRVGFHITGTFKTPFGTNLLMERRIVPDAG